MHRTLICKAVIVVLLLATSSIFAQTKIYDISTASINYARLLWNGEVTIGFKEDVGPCRTIRLRGENLFSVGFADRISAKLNLFEIAGREEGETLEIELNGRCEVISLISRELDTTDRNSWVAFVYGTQRIAEQRERENPTTGETETYTHYLNKVAWGEIFADASSRETALQNAQLTCETDALERGLDSTICDTPLTIEGRREACISYATTYDSSSFGRFIGVSSGINHIQVKKKAVENCVSAVNATESEQTCDAYEDTKCNDYGHLYDPE